jgi:hypothetical protein
VRARSAIVCLALLLTVALPSPAGAHDLTPEKTKITDLVVTQDGALIEVGGAASFGGQKLLSLGKDAAGDATAGIKEIDLVEAKLGQLDPSNGDLNFVFKLADLPVLGGIPEVADYEWEFRVAPLERPVFRLQGSFTRLRAGRTEVPSFVLHTCMGGPSLTCESSPVVAEFVGTDNEIFVDAPRALLETKLARSIAGTTVAPADEGWRELETRLADGARADELTHWSPYQIAYPRVDVGIAPAGGTPASTVAAGVASDGTFAASLDTTGLPAGEHDVVATACYGTNCATWRTRVTL